MFAAFIITYAQGLSLLTAASAEKNYELNLAEISKIWRGGCIIRATLLEEFRHVFTKTPQLENILFDGEFIDDLKEHLNALRKIVTVSAESGFPGYCAMSCLAYFDAISSERLPANLLQAQRDFLEHTPISVWMRKELFILLTGKSFLTKN